MRNCDTVVILNHVAVTVFQVRESCRVEVFADRIESTWHGGVIDLNELSRRV